MHRPLRKLLPWHFACILPLTAVGCSASHEPRVVVHDDAATFQESVDASAPAIEVVDASVVSEPPPSADRARASATHSYCDEASGTFGIYLEDLDECWTGPRTPRECFGADLFDTVYLLDARQAVIKGSLRMELLSEDAVYAEGSLEALDDTEVCSDLAEYIVVAVSHADARIEATIFDDRSVGGGAGFSRSNPDCLETIHEAHAGADRLDLFAFAQRGELLRGPEPHAVAEDGGVTPETARLVEDCEQLLGYLVVLYRGDTLLTVYTD